MVQARLEAEYGVPTQLEGLPYVIARWVDGPDEILESWPARSEVLVARDTQDRTVVLFDSPFYLKYYTEKFPELTYKEVHQG